MKNASHVRIHILEQSNTGDDHKNNPIEIQCKLNVGHGARLLELSKV